MRDLYIQYVFYDMVDASNTLTRIYH